MQTTLISNIFSAILKLLPSDLIIEGLQGFSKWLRQRIVDSPNKVDDTILPLLDALDHKIK